MWYPASQISHMSNCAACSSLQSPHTSHILQLGHRHVQRNRSAALGSAGMRAFTQYVWYASPQSMHSSIALVSPPLPQQPHRSVHASFAASGSGIATASSGMLFGTVARRQHRRKHTPRTAYAQVHHGVSKARRSGWKRVEAGGSGQRTVSCGLGPALQRVFLGRGLGFGLLQHHCVVVQAP